MGPPPEASAAERPIGQFAAVTTGSPPGLLAGPPPHMQFQSPPFTHAGAGWPSFGMWPSPFPAGAHGAGGTFPAAGAHMPMTGASGAHGVTGLPHSAQLRQQTRPARPCCFGAACPRSDCWFDHPAKWPLHAQHRPDGANG